MTTYLTLAMNAIDEPKIDKYWISYFRENFRGEVNDKLVEVFISTDITKADIARKLDRRPEQITRWLSAPCNLEVDTISDIALSLGLAPRITFEKIGQERTNSQIHNFIVILESTTETKQTGTSIINGKSDSVSSGASNEISHVAGTVHSASGREIAANA